MEFVIAESRLLLSYSLLSLSTRNVSEILCRITLSLDSSHISQQHHVVRWVTIPPSAVFQFYHVFYWKAEFTGASFIGPFCLDYFVDQPTDQNIEKCLRQLAIREFKCYDSNC
jgi:hypothetical protein